MLGMQSFVQIIYSLINELHFNQLFKLTILHTDPILAHFNDTPDLDTEIAESLSAHR